MSKFIFSFLILFSSAIASDKIGIIKIFDQFAISNAIASMCEKPNQKVLAKFIANFEVISNYVQIELEKKHPSATKDKIKKVMKMGVEQITSNAKKLVDKKGCDDPSIQEAIKRFYAQAEWDI